MAKQRIHLLKSFILCVESLINFNTTEDNLEVCRVEIKELNNAQSKLIIELWPLRK
jgi:hypothetical protein